MEKEFRKLTSRILRHSGFIAVVNKETKEYELKLNSESEPVLFCKHLIVENEKFICFRVNSELSEEASKLYQRIVNRFGRLDPSVQISFENELEPIFTDEQLQVIEEMVKEFEA